MEEICKKDIFVEEKLQKHSPDYSPKDIFLRMQLRRNMVRDTHRHGASRCNISKKDIKKAKSSQNLKKEMVKLRAYFENMNLNHQSKLKNVKKIQKMKLSRDKSNGIKLNNNENEMVVSEMALFIKQYENDNANLVIENDNDFKLFVKEKNKVQDHCLRNNYIELGKNVIKYDNNNSKIHSVNSNDITCLTENEQKVICTENTNEFKNDLQSLLIMMAINSNANENVTPRDISYTENVKKETVVSVQSNNSRLLHKNLEQSYTLNTKDLDPVLNVTSLRREINCREKCLATKFFKKWKNFVDKRKQNVEMKKRDEILNKFFDKLSKKKNHTAANTESVQKANIFAKDYNTYQHRYKVQKHIIALQKTKLEEQNKLIEQLKYNKIVEATHQSIDVLKEDVKKTYYEIDKHLKPKIKCMTNELKIKDIEEPSLILHCLKVPQFLQRMEARAREREEKHAMIRERRKQLEEERFKQKQQAEIAKAEMDKEEKQKRLKELKEKRKKEKIENIRKKQHAQRLRALIVMADIHNERRLMINYGINPLKRLIEIKRDNIEKAKAHYKFLIIKNVFLHWMWHTEDMWFDRNYKAEDFYRKKILKKTFSAFKKNHHEFILKRQVAEDYYDIYVTQLGFRKFRKGVEISKNEFEMKWKKAVVYYNSNILFRTFTCWRTLPGLNALKREQDMRKLRWREKVLLVVPDYKPPED